MKVLISGASGFIGRALSRRLTESGHDPIALVRGGPGAGTRTWEPSAGRIDDDPSRAVSLAGRDRLVDLGSRLWPLVVTVALLLALTTTIGPLLVAAGAIVAAVAGNMAGRAVPGGMSAVPVVVGVLFLTLAGIWLLNAGLSWNSWGGMVLNLSLATISRLIASTRPSSPEPKINSTGSDEPT